MSYLNRQCKLWCTSKDSYKKYIGHSKRLSKVRLIEELLTWDRQRSRSQQMVRHQGPSHSGKPPSTLDLKDQRERQL